MNTNIFSTRGLSTPSQGSVANAYYRGEFPITTGNGNNMPFQHGYGSNPYANPSPWYDANMLNQSVVSQQFSTPVVPKQYSNSSNGRMARQTSDTDNELQRMLANNHYIDDKTKEMLFRNQSLIQRLFPTQKDRLIAEMQGKAVQTALDFRLNLYRLSTEFKLEALREHFNALLLTIRGEYRARVSEFMLTKLTELHQIVKAKQFAFFEIAKEKVQYAQTIPPMFQGRYLATIEQEGEGFLTFTQRQISHYEAIIDEQIKREV